MSANANLHKAKDAKNDEYRRIFIRKKAGA